VSGAPTAGLPPASLPALPRTHSPNTCTDPHSPPPHPPSVRAIAGESSAADESAWAPIEVSARKGVRQMGMPTMDGEEEDEPDKGTSFRVPKGVKQAA
jgi:hypothetical protein